MKEKLSIIPTEEDEDLILPNNLLFEVIYIFWELKNILKVTNKDDYWQKQLRLERQIRIWVKWMGAK